MKVLIILVIIFFVLALFFAFLHEIWLFADGFKVKVVHALSYVFLCLFIATSLLLICSALLTPAEVPPEQPDVYLRC